MERERAVLLGKIVNLKTDRDQWRNQATMLLTHKKPDKEPQKPVLEPFKTEQTTWSLPYAKLFGCRSA
jgi:hypothetical protein